MATPAQRAQPLVVRASQQLGFVPAHVVPPCGALHAALTLHLVVPLLVVSQHVERPDAPQVDFTAHLRTAAAHTRVSVLAFTAVFNAPRTHFT